MVLRIIIAFLVFSGAEPDLYEVYNCDVSKTIKRVLKTKDVEFSKGIYTEKYLKEIISGDQTIGFIYIGSVSACTLSGCSGERPAANVNREYFDMMLLMNNQQEILDISILDYFSDYGYEITSKRYLKKFKGKQLCDFSTKVDGIDGISGATITCNALESQLDMLCQALSI